jgi:hypothetical protein
MNSIIQAAFIDELQKIAAGVKPAFGVKPPKGFNLPSAPSGASKTPIAEEIAKKYAPKTQIVRPSTLKPGSGSRGIFKVKKSPLFARR